MSEVEGSSAYGPRSSVLGHLFDLPPREKLLQILGDDGLVQLLAEANEIVDGRVRLFGGEPVPLGLSVPGELHHWTNYEQGSRGAGERGGEGDVKFVWEPARFGWAFTLARAYHLSGDERFPEVFWRYFEIFTEANPVNMGPNWTSAQEVALRILAFTFAARIFASSSHSTAIRHWQLAISIADHAARIPPTLVYARSQNNNHLLSEAAGLITAALALPDHPAAPRWEKLGWKWFNRGLESQIAEDGAYMQNSTNYHRLMLQLALWVHASRRVSESANQQVGKFLTPNRLTPNPQLLTPNLQLLAATHWLLALTDPETGRAPNLGPNDGAYILPFTVLPYHDYRPVLQAASRAFLGQPAFGPGSWDEMGLWFGESASRRVSESTIQRAGESANIQQITPNLLTSTSLTSTLPASRSWAYLRAARFTSRPGHADQLHLDLWWRGLNVAQDAGTYLYNASPPWDNTLTHTAVHNTVTVDGQEQMTRAGRFLYLDRAQAEVTAREQAEDGSWQRITAQHDGYRRLGVIHQRSVTAYQDNLWIVEDQLLSSGRRSEVGTRLHWLLPDWGFEIGDKRLKIRLQSPFGIIQLSVSLQSSVSCPQSPIPNLKSQIIRAGKLLHGSGPTSPTWGWASPTYGVKVPALSFSVSTEGVLPITFVSEWEFTRDGL